MSVDTDLPESVDESQKERADRFAAAIVAAREAANISHQQAAKELRLELSVVQALEHADFSPLGAPVFIKGHLRAYEKLLGLQSGSLVELYELIQPVVEMKVAVQKPETAQSANLAPWSLGLLIFVAVVGVAWFLLSGGSDNESAAAVPVVEEQVAAKVDVAEPVAADSTPVVASGVATIVLKFTDECWVEITDAKGLLLESVQAAGAVRTLTGTPPFSFIFGNAKAVSLMVDGVAYQLPARTVRGDTARFKLTAADIQAVKDSTQ
ncbi:MAG: cytoskeleton protein RodZ [Gammaproteobacteria bacterium]|jgi:cytoskeleton protein RodZ|tara:strand:- start:2725 stop:3522 length:798 start_codon:yes stop_codon:yes gene_type:complete